MLEYLSEAESLRWSSMKDHERRELTTIAGVSLSFVKMDWKRIPPHIKKKLENVISKSTKGEYQLVESVADQIMMSVASMSPVALVGTMTAGAILGDKFLKFLRGDELAQMKRKIERDPAANAFVEDMRTDKKFKKLKRIVNKLARDVKKNPDDPEFKTLFKKAAAELNAYVQIEYKKHSRKFKDRYRGTKVGRQAMRQMMGIKEDAQLVKKSMKLDERGLPTYVYDRKTGKPVHGPTDVADAKLFVKKQIQPNKFVIRQIRGRGVTQR
jgi:hypothetical protein|tara:strand:+ start:246 stop:1052 length:807 start_codon:yes stop_codon:yes gene_type:complete